MPQETADVRTEVRFVTAPGFDLLSACHLVADPAHHAFAGDWVEEAMDGAHPEVLEAAKLLSLLPMAGLELGDLFRPVWNQPPARVSDRVAAASREAVQKALLERTVSPDELSRSGLEEAVRAAIEERPWVLSGRTDAVSLAVSDPLALRDAAVILARHLAAAVAGKLAELAGPYQEAVHELERAYTTSGLAPPDFAQREMGKSFVHRGPYRAWYFVPSWFLTPHKLRVWDDERCFVVLGRAANVTRVEAKVKQLSSLFSLLADKNRLLILHMLMVKPHYGRQMAPRLGLTPATVSHHLDALSQAGLVDARTAGKTKYFALNRERLARILELFDDFLANR